VIGREQAPVPQRQPSPILYSMAESISEKPVTEGVRLIERLSTEFEVFLILLSAILAADISLYFYKKQNILTFNWKFDGELNIGAILTSFLLFSFTMTFVSRLIVVALKFVWSFLPDRLTSLIVHNRAFAYSKHGYTLVPVLEKQALSENNTFMLDLVRRHREHMNQIRVDTRKDATLAVSLIVLVGLDWWISQGTPGTLVQVVLNYAGTNRVVAGILLLFGLYLILTIKEELAQNYGEDWVLYPPLAGKED